MKTAILLVALLLVGQAHAQLRKCIGPDGKITYSDVLCAGTSKSTQTLDTPPGPSISQSPRPSQASVYEKELSSKIAGYLNNNDFEAASKIAATAEHHQMIADARLARQSKAADKKAAKRAAQPTVCRTYGQTNGTVNNYGYIKGYSGTYQGTTVCNK